jgi:hypothetical protein
MTNQIDAPADLEQFASTDAQGSAGATQPAQRTRIFEVRP